MLGRSPDTKIATDWAIKHFHISQFSDARREKLYQERKSRRPKLIKEPQRNYTQRRTRNGLPRQNPALQ